ncbi:MAG: Asp-tRNA(Asn)/Glu-tRNA(Gln) amidotransferase subunit GatC [Lachnospiraceae bacterium]|nr:Asp-tRNA(Asn)/Glu-tRNA(Gln) amidotransferase subunit GatC [Lachnospiraceae bacterium]
MYMEISDEMVAYVEALAKLALDGRARERAKEDLSRILGYMDTMNAVDTKEVMPMSHVFPLKNVFRDDVVTNGEEAEALLANAPHCKEGKFAVPKTVGQEEGKSGSMDEEEI